MKWNPFSRKEETVSKAEHERLLSHARYQRDYWMAEAKRLAVEHQRRIAPLMAANAARKAAAQAKKSRDKQQAEVGA